MNQAQVNASHISMTSLVPAPCEVSRRKVNAKLVNICEMTMEYAVEHRSADVCGQRAIGRGQLNLFRLNWSYVA